MSLTKYLTTVDSTSTEKLIESVWVAILLTTISYAVGLVFGWIPSINPLEVFAVATSYSCTWMVVKQSRWNYLMGVVTVIAYALLFYQANLLASSVLNIYLIFQLAYGWFRWGQDADTRPVTHVSWNMLPIYAGVTGLTYLIATFIMSSFGGSLAMWDVVILVGSILAQFLLDNKKLETWVVWFIVNVVSIFLYFNMGLTLVAFQYVFFLINTFYGAYEWWKSMYVQPSLKS